jgi:aspartyl-tRNA(Asn)/glutamyl-tRNA(Gln) amidotransferase subunit A
LTRSVRDAALYLDIVSGYHPSDPHSIPKPASSFLAACSAEFPRAPLRIACSRNLGYIDHVWPEVEQGFQHALGVLAAHPRLHLIEIEREFVDICTAWVTLLGSEQCALLSQHPEISNGLDQLEKSFVGMWDTLKTITLADLAGVYRQRFQLTHQLEQLFSEYDLLLTPTMPISGFPPTGPMPMEGFSSPLHPAAGFTIPFNFSGHPAASIRVHPALPSVGLQIVAPRHRDDLVLQFAHFYEKASRSLTIWPTVSASSPTASSPIASSPTASSPIASSPTAKL